MINTINKFARADLLGSSLLRAPHFSRELRHESQPILRQSVHGPAAAANAAREFLRSERNVWVTVTLSIPMMSAGSRSGDGGRGSRLSAPSPSHVWLSSPRALLRRRASW